MANKRKILIKMRNKADPISVFSRVKCVLGESPLWHPLRNSLFWLDILECRLYEKAFDSEAAEFDRVWELPETGSALALDGNSSDSLFIVTDISFSRINLETGRFSQFISLSSNVNMRANDGGVAPNGDFWFGTMEKNPTGQNGAVYSISSNGEITHQLAGIGIPNTFAWSLDGRLLYLSDSIRQKMFVFEVDDGHAVSHSRKTTFINLSSTDATPDGGAMDSDGNLWNAQWGGFNVKCYSPRGEVLDSIELPVPQVSSCCFGGSGNSSLFITSAREGMSEAELEKYPLSGCVFIKKMRTGFGVEPSVFVANYG